MIKTIATDLDGTLFYPKSKLRLITSKNKKFLHEFLQDDKRNLILVSGRNYTLAEKIKKRLEVNCLSMIACNGGCIYHDGKIVEENPLSKEDIKFLYEYTQKLGDIHIWLSMTSKMPIIVKTKDVSKAFEFCGKIGMSMQGAYYEGYVFGDEEFNNYLNDPECKFYKFMPVFGFTKEAEDKAKAASEIAIKEIGNKYEVVWSGTSIEINKKGINKANALKKLLNMLNLKECETAVIGDSGNDVPLFKNFENSFCMAQAHESVRSEAKHIVTGVYELEDYLK